jgi:hypothetical protein
LGKAKKAQLYKVVYQPDRQAEFLFSEIKLLADSFLAVGFDLADNEVFMHLVGHTGMIEEHCALIKDVAFREESELRLVVPNFNVKSGGYKIMFRARNNLIVPYIEIDLSTSWNTSVTEIVIGPGPDRDVRQKNIEHFLRQIDLGVPVRFSSCQFR